MMRRTLLALALLAAPAVVMAQQPSPMQGQAPAADTSKAKAEHKSSQKSSSSHKSSKKHESKPAAKPAAKPATKDTAKAKP